MTEFERLNQIRDALLANRQAQQGAIEIAQARIAQVDQDLISVDAAIAALP